MDAPCCCCPTVKLIGCNLDSSIHYLSPRAKVKCCDLCRLTCDKCRQSRATIIRPGDGERYDMASGGRPGVYEAGGNAPYDFNSDPYPQPEPVMPRPGFRIGPDYIHYPERDFIEGNAVNTSLDIPKNPHPRIVVDRFGRTTDYCLSGFARDRICNPVFGRMPKYMCSIKERMALEDYKLRCVLGREGRVCKDPGHNIMNQIGLLEMLNSTNPLVMQSKFYIKPKLDLPTGRNRIDCSHMPHPGPR